MGAAPLKKEPSIDGSVNRRFSFQRSRAYEKRPGPLGRSGRLIAVPAKEGSDRKDAPLAAEIPCAPARGSFALRNAFDSEREKPAQGGSSCDVVVLTADKALAGYLQTALRRAGYATFWAATISHVLSISRQLAPFLVLVDCRIREWPVIRTEPTLRHVLLIAVIPTDCSYPEDRCLDDLACGIDGVYHMEDAPQLLMAAVDAYLRRWGGNVPRRGLYRVGAVELDADAHDLRIAGQPVRLSAKPFAILKALMQSYPAVRRRDELLTRIWGPGFAIGGHVLDVHIHTLRKELNRRPSGLCRLVAIRRIGFKLEVFSQGSAQPRRRPPSSDSPRERTRGLDDGPLRRLPRDRITMPREAPGARRRSRPESCGPGSIEIPTQ